MILTSTIRLRALLAWAVFASLLFGVVPFGGVSASHASAGTYLPFTNPVDEGGGVRTSTNSLGSYPKSGELFFRLSFDTREAQVVGYNRQMVVTPGSPASIDVPNTVTFSASYLQSLTGTGKTSTELAGFADTYTVTAVGPSAFYVFQTAGESAETRVLIDQLTLPATLKAIGINAFTGQCALTRLVVPDLVTDVGANAFSGMTKNFANNPSCANETGLTTFTLGAQVERLGTNAFSALNELSSLSFRGPRFPDRGGDNATILPAGYERWGTSPAALMGGMELNNTCQTRFTYVYGLTLSVIASNSSDWTAWATEGNCFAANSVTITTFVPSIAAAPVASNPSYTTTSLAFTTPTYTGGEAVTEYQVESQSTSGTVLHPAFQNLTSPTLVSGLYPNRSYTFKIRAKNSAGWTDFSSASNSVTTLTATAPADQAAPVASAPTLNSAVVSFATPANGGMAILEYEVTATPGGFITFVNPAPGSPTTIGQLASSTDYTFTVRARNAIGWSNPSPASNTITTLTPTPTPPAQAPAPAPAPTPIPTVPPTPEATPSPTPTPSVPISNQALLTKTVGAIYFNGDSAVLTAKAKDALKAIAKIYSGKARMIEVHGFVQRTQETRYDQRLSTQRATTVVEYLKRLKLNAIYKPSGKGISPDPTRRARKAVLTVTLSR